MKQMDYLKMKTEDEFPSNQLSSDLKEVHNAAKKLASDVIKLGGLGFGTSFLQWVASFSAIYLLVLDRTNWKTEILTGLLVPYIFFSLPGILFDLLRGEVGMWIAFVTVILRVFFPQRFPDWLELPGVGIKKGNTKGIDSLPSMILECHWILFGCFIPSTPITPGSIILIIVVAPSLLASYVRGGSIGAAICLVIGGYLLQEHIRASGGFRNSFTRANGVSNTVGIILLLVYPVWFLIVNFL